MNWQAGEPIGLKIPLTVAAMNCGLRLDSTGWVTFVDQNLVSFYIGRTGGWIEASCPLDIFAANFVERKGGSFSRGHILSKPYAKVFPRDFLS